MQLLSLQLITVQQTDDLREPQHAASLSLRRFTQSITFTACLLRNTDHNNTKKKIKISYLDLSKSVHQTQVYFY